MMERVLGRVREMFAGFVDFGKVITTSFSDEADTVQITLRGVQGLDLAGQELWGNAAVLMRPADPDADGRAAEVMFFRMGDELVGFASRDTRWQVTLDKGEVCIRALGASAAQIRLKPDGTVLLGSGAASDPVALTTQVDANFSTLLTLLQTWTVSTGDGGLALKTAALALTTPTVAATKVKAE